MRRREQLLWVSALVLCLAPFSFFAGLGFRGLYRSLSDTPRGLGPGYPRLASAAPRAAEVDAKPQLLFADVLSKLRYYSVEPLPPDNRLAHSSVEAMLNSLSDPNTRLLSPVEVKAYEAAAQGEFRGIGAVLTVERFNDRAVEPVAGEPEPGIRTVTVVTVAPGSPAAGAGLLPGDHITEIDGQWISPSHLSYRLLTQITDPTGLQDGRPLSPDDTPIVRGTPEERAKIRLETDSIRARYRNARDLNTALQLLNGAADGEHELTVMRGTPRKTLKMKISNGTTRPELSASKKLSNGAGYLQVFLFNNQTLAAAETALAGFQSAGVKQLVLDLRGNAGGNLEVTRKFAGLLMGTARFAVLRERDLTRKLIDRPVTGVGAARMKPTSISVLVDGGTAGTAELLAAALREQSAARLVGTTTFGDGTEQELARLEDGSGICITRARMLTSKSVEFATKGLKPDVAAIGDALDAAVKLSANRPAAR